MASISAIEHPWRRAWQNASFRGVTFHVETGAQAGGRRIALHQYPKRNVPYAEDMGKSANTFPVTAYIIGPDYLPNKDNLIEALEKDGPGMLVLPLPYKQRHVEVMVQSYSVTETRERGGICTIEMSFVEYGNPSYRAQSSTPAQVDAAAKGVEGEVQGPLDPKTASQAEPYAQVHRDANVPTPGNAPL
jgi:prophage DNA circulation protein